LSFIPYQERSGELREIPEDYFKKAVRMVGPNGAFYTGAAAVYRALHYTAKWKFLWWWYTKSTLFKVISDRGYLWISKNRPFLLRTSILFSAMILSV
jgi:predicted DCC family thiol-disulfide oxidoreductase YuxK